MCPLYGISLFLPTIIRNLGYTSSTAQLMTVPIYITAAVLAVLAAYASDRVGKRSPFILFFLCMMAVGFIMCISSSNPHVVYGGVFVAACAIYPAFPGVITWLSNNLAGSYKRSAGMAIQIGVGNLGGVGCPPLLHCRSRPGRFRSSFPRQDSLTSNSLPPQAMASNFYRAADSPRYVLGHALELGFIGGGIIALIILVVGYGAANKKRDRAMREGDVDVSGEELSAQGDKAATFKYMF